MGEGKSPSGEVANVLDCDMEVSELEFQSCYYIHFWINILGKRYGPADPMG